jgi:WD40 repeat protein
MIWERRRRAKMGSTEVKLTWCETKPLRGHNKEVYDLCWSNCGNFLVSASLDNRAILWNVGKQKLIQVMDGHTSYV